MAQNVRLVEENKFLKEEIQKQKRLMGEKEEAAEEKEYECIAKIQGLELEHNRLYSFFTEKEGQIERLKKEKQKLKDENQRLREDTKKLDKLNTQLFTHSESMKEQIARLTKEKQDQEEEQGRLLENLNVLTNKCDELEKLREQLQVPQGAAAETTVAAEDWAEDNVEVMDEELQQLQLGNAAEEGLEDEFGGGEEVGSKIRCLQCQGSFANPSNLARHVIAVHKKTKSFRCDKCGEMFGRPDVLKEHQRAACENKLKKQHKVAKPPTLCRPSSSVWQCMVCEKTFKKNSDLLKHNFTHTKERNETCVHCNAAFSRRDVLTKHIKNLHPDMYI